MFFCIYVNLSRVELCSRIGDLPTLFKISSRIFIKITRKFIFIAIEVYMTIDISVDCLFKLFSHQSDFLLIL